MLTYRTGAAGSPSAALAMAKHLLQQTLPADKADLALYYLRGMKPPTQADEALARFAELVVGGTMTREDAIEALIGAEVERAAANPMAQSAQPGRPTDPTAEALGMVVAAGLMDRADAAARLGAGEAGGALPGLPAAAPPSPAQQPPSPAPAPPRPARGAVRQRVISPAEAEAQFRDALERMGLRPNGSLKLDGNSHYCPLEGKGKKNTSGLYRYRPFPDGWPGGFIKNMATGESHQWVANGGTVKVVSAEERAAEIARREEVERQRQQQAQEREAAVAAEVARVWAAALPAVTHPYLTKKGVGPEGLRVGAPGLNLNLTNESGEAYELRTAGKLLVPMQDIDGKLWSLQLIDAAGDKKYLGGGRRKETFAVLGDLAGDGPISLGEGVATMKTVRAGLNVPAVAAFDANGLMSVALALRERYPERPIILAADNDHTLPLRPVLPGRLPLKNVGLEKAEAAAQAVGGAVAVPTFKPDTTEIERQAKDLSDWNDWHAEQEGNAEAKTAALAAAFAPALEAALHPLAEGRERAAQAVREHARGGAEAALDEAIAWAQNARESGGTVARVRSETHPLLAERLGLPMTRPLVSSEIANLLNGQRTDGANIVGKQIQKPTLPLTELLDLSPAYRPVREEIEHILAGRTANGNVLEGKAGVSARRRFLTKFGCKADQPTLNQRENLLAGNMADGTPLSHHDYVRRVDSSKARIGYIDMTFSASKSFSVAWALEPTPAGRAILDQAFNDAVATTMRHAETVVGQARKGKGAKGGYEQGSMTWAEFDHYASRPTVAIVQKDGKGNSYTERVTVTDGALIAADPQRHKHVLVPNTVLAPDGRLVGLDLQRLDETVHELGAFMQWQLGVELAKHGVATELDERTKMLRLSAVSEPLCQLMSKRTVNGTDAAREYAAGLGLDWDSLSGERQKGLMKQGVQGDHRQAERMGLPESVGRQLKRDGMGDWQAWEAQAKEAGYECASVLGQVVEERDIPALRQEAFKVALQVLEEEFDKRAGLSGGDLRTAALRGLIATSLPGGVEEVNALTKRMRDEGVRQGGQDTTLEYGKVKIKGREVVRATTKLHVAQEFELIDLAQRAHLDRSALLDPAKLAKAVAKFEAIPVEQGGLRFGDDHGKAQRHMMDRIAADGRLSVLIGVAGSGKSSLLRPLVSAWKDEGRRVFGIALAWTQADGLVGAGIDFKRAKANAAFLHSITKGAIELTSRDVVVVDEVGLVGTAQLLQLMRLQAEVGFSVVMLGDPKQCQSIEAGPVISLLQRALGKEAVPELLTTTRQLNDEEKATTGLFREGKAEQALLRKQANGTLHVVPGDYTAAVRFVADKWQELRNQNTYDPKYTVSISAPTNYDARMISAAIREKRRQREEIGPDVVTIDATDQSNAHAFKLALAVGDRVRLFDSIRGSFTDGRQGNIGRNASVLEVRGFREAEKGHEAGILLRNVRGNEAWVSWTTLRGRNKGNIRLTYGDVLTTNSVQSMTVDDHIHAMPGGTKGVNGFAAYTSGSRHRRSVHVVTSDGAERDEVTRRRPLGDARPVREWDVTQNIARNLSRQPEKNSAIGILEMVGKMQHGVALGLQQSMHRAEEREREGLDRGDLQTAFEGHQVAEQVQGIAARLEALAARHSRGVAKMREMGPAMRSAVERGMGRLSPALGRAIEAMRQQRVQARDTSPDL